VLRFAPKYWHNPMKEGKPAANGPVVDSHGTFKSRHGAEGTAFALIQRDAPAIGADKNRPGGSPISESPAQSGITHRVQAAVTPALRPMTSASERRFVYQPPSAVP